MLSILFKNYKEYKEKEYKLILPKEIKIRTEMYLKSSCNILSWFNEFYEKIDDANNIIKIKDIFNNFKSCEYYNLLSKNDKRKYNYNYFNEYFANNIFLKSNYKESCKLEVAHIFSYKYIND